MFLYPRLRHRFALNKVGRGLLLMRRQPAKLRVLALRVPKLGEDECQQRVACRVIIVDLEGLAEVLGGLAVALEVELTNCDVKTKVPIRRITLIGSLKSGQGFRVATVPGENDAKIVPYLIQGSLLGERGESFLGFFLVAQEEFVNADQEKGFQVVRVLM